MNNSQERTALIAGASGLVGGQLLKLLLESDEYLKVVSVGRRQLDLSHAKLSQVVTDFENLQEHQEKLSANDVFCCLGTTIAKAGSKATFRKVDFEYVLALGAVASQMQADQFLLVSALGANAQSRIFYNQVKGELEEAIVQIGLPTIHVLRPSLLLGPRQEFRAGELIAQKLSPIIPWIGALRNIKPISAMDVAQALLNLALQRKSGQFYYPSRQIEQIARN